MLKVYPALPLPPPPPSSQELQLKMVKACIPDLVDIVLVPYSSWNAEVAQDQLARPDIVQWNPELRNATGMLRNVSSAGEPARVYMRKTPMLIDALLWILKAGVQQVSAADEKVYIVLHLIINGC